MASKRTIEAGRATLRVTLDGKGMAKALRGLQRHISNFSASLTQFGRRLAGVGLAVSAAFAGALRVFAPFSDQVKFLGAVSQATGAELKSMADQAKALGRSTAFTASQVAGLQVELAKLGFGVSDIKAMTQAMLSLGSVSRAELADVASTAGATIRQFGLSARDTDKVVDIMAKSFASSALDLEKFAVAMTKVGPVARNMGFELEGTTALIGQLANAGFDASTAGTATKNILLTMADSNGKLARALGRTVTNVDDLVPALAELEAKGVDVAQALELTDKRTVAAFLTFLRGTDGVSSLNMKLKDSAGFAKRAAEEMESGLGGAFRRVQSAAEGVAIAIGESLSPTVTKLADLVANAGVKLGEWIDANQAVILNAAKLTAGITAAGAAILTATAALAGLSAVVSALTTPLGLVAGALVGIAAGFTDVEALTSSVSKSFEDVKSSIMDALDAGDMKLAAEMFFLAFEKEFLKWKKNTRDNFRTGIISAVGDAAGIVSPKFGRQVRDFAKKEGAFVDKYTDSTEEKRIRKIDRRMRGLRAQAARGGQQARADAQARSLSGINPLPVPAGAGSGPQGTALMSRAAMQGLLFRSSMLGMAGSAASFVGAGQTTAEKLGIFSEQSKARGATRDAMFDTRFAEQIFGGKKVPEKQLEEAKKSRALLEKMNEKIGMAFGGQGLPVET